MAELASFQNPDGGYGHGLEPDAHHAASSVLDTTHALQVMRRLGIAADHPQAQAAVRFLHANQDTTHHLWPIRPLMPPGTPAAPWWTYRGPDHWAKQMAEGTLNPTAEVLGYLIAYATNTKTKTDTDATNLKAVRATVQAHLAQTPDTLEMHDLLCVARLARTPGLDPDWAHTLIAHVRRAAAKNTDPDPTNWGAYAFKPWTLATHPDDPLLDDIDADLISAMLDHEIDRQGDDGAWAPAWDWHDKHPTHWPRAAQAWKGVLTEHMLRVLRHFGRLENPAASEG